MKQIKQSLPTPTRDRSKLFRLKAKNPRSFFNTKLHLQAELEHFIQCCDTRSTPKTDGMQGERVVKMLEMAMQQLKEGEQGSHA